MYSINWLAIIIAGIVGFFPGALWYSPLLFLKPWARELGMDLSARQQPKHFPLILLGGLTLSIVVAIALSLIIGPAPGLHRALFAAGGCALGLVGASFGIQYLFEGRSITFWAINAGYHFAQFLLIGIVLGLMR